MKTINLLPILMLFCFSTGFLYAQDYVSYFNRCNEAAKAMYLHDYEVALSTYEDAFELVDYVNAGLYKDASMCAAKLREFNKARQYAKMAILHGSSPSFLVQRKLKTFRKSSQYASLVDSLEFFHTQHLSSINQPYKSLVDSLHYIDQRIIRDNYTVSGSYNIDKSSFSEELYELDSGIFNCLLDQIEQYGFPSEETLGPLGYRRAAVILLHALKKPENEAYFAMCEEALREGKYQPHDYAWAYDQAQIIKEEPPLFYYNVLPLDDLSPQQLTDIALIRHSFGVRPMEAFKIKVKAKKRRIMTKVLW